MTFRSFTAIARRSLSTCTAWIALDASSARTLRSSKSSFRSSTASLRSSKATFRVCRIHCLRVSARNSTWRFRAQDPFPLSRVLRCNKRKSSEIMESFSNHSEGAPTIRSTQKWKAERSATLPSIVHKEARQRERTRRTATRLSTLTQGAFMVKCLSQGERRSKDEFDKHKRLSNCERWDVEENKRSNHFYQHRQCGRPVFQQSGETSRKRC